MSATMMEPHQPTLLLPEVCKSSLHKNTLCIIMKTECVVIANMNVHVGV